MLLMSKEKSEETGKSGGETSGIEVLRADDVVREPRRVMFLLITIEIKSVLKRKKKFVRFAKLGGMTKDLSHRRIKRENQRLIEVKMKEKKGRQGSCELSELTL
ncbi:unnamed protein product [Microthlaspi erraticum]|uniref:Uncharacterized protein n=1 Tax=Microthlaspi erraticum TaxID=1685480 RepID=A0A6D2HXG5_9BRAS|nr:unnamed protein product [Microthlaspi erraticum]